VAELKSLGHPVSDNSDLPAEVLARHDFACQSERFVRLNAACSGTNQREGKRPKAFVRRKAEAVRTDS
jgi:hypothetical protein